MEMPPKGMISQYRGPMNCSKMRPLWSSKRVFHKEMRLWDLISSGMLGRSCRCRRKDFPGKDCGSAAAFAPRDVPDKSPGEAEEKEYQAKKIDKQAAGKAEDGAVMDF